MRSKLVWVTFCLLAFTACKINKKPKYVAELSIEKIILDEVIVSPDKKRISLNYQLDEKSNIDLLHTRLEISFDYKRQWVYGMATLTIKPSPNSLNSISLDARGFTVNRVALVQHTDTVQVLFHYDGLHLRVDLPDEKERCDTFVLFIDYIAKPAELPNEGGNIITDSRGLYFINPLGTDPNKPRQIWTQGETQYNSAWFPTHDVPNEKHTQDLFITMDNKDVSLSNGSLMGSTQNKNGTRTDHWQQLKPHAPYLTMMAIGDFKVVKDKWRNTEVNYYLEPDYEPDARLIFGKTPQMIETFSKITGVDYPWDKFSQVVCRDFVSGAMENTSAVVHFEGVQHHTREHLDNTMEEIIVYELFHQWFGDLVTCKSWSHITLNESFATYGEYLWNEKTYGKAYADMMFSKNLDAYLRSRNKYQVSLVRNSYKNSDEVFDVVSYQKGSWILHALRNQIGDTAFFKGMNLYLTQNKFGVADVNHLRHAMEEASGKDLNVFFTEWYFGKGHPELSVNYYFDKAAKKLMVVVKQIQDSSFPTFHLNTQLVYAFHLEKGEPVVHKLNLSIKNKDEIFTIDCENDVEMNNDPDLFYIDANGSIPGVLRENKTPEAWLNQLKYGASYPVQLRAIRTFMAFKPDSLMPLIQEAISFCLNRNEDYFILNGLNIIQKHPEQFSNFESKVISLAHHKNYARIRNQALEILAIGKNPAYKNEFISGLKDSSYVVMSTCLYALEDLDPDSVLYWCSLFEAVPGGQLQTAISGIYSDLSRDNKNKYFKNTIGKYGLYRSNILKNYGVWLRYQSDTTIAEGIIILENFYEKCSDLNKAIIMQKILKGIENEIESESNSMQTEVHKKLKTELSKFENLLDSSVK